MKKLIILLAMVLLITACQGKSQTVQTKDIEADPVDEKIYVEPIDEDTFKRTKLLIQKELEIFDFNDEHDLLQVKILDVVNVNSSDEEMKVAIESIVSDHMEGVKRKTIERVLTDNEIPYSSYDVDDLMRVTSNDQLIEIVVAFEYQVTKESLNK